MATTVQTLVYSGPPNPTFVLDGAQELKFAGKVKARMAVAAVPERPVIHLGYSGFEMDPAAALGLPQSLTVTQGLLVGETDGVTTAWTDTGGECEEYLKQQARAAGQGALVDPDRGDP